jgi:hypothetical protein
MELQKNFRVFSKSVEEYMSRLFSDFQKPVEAFKPYIRKIHIDASVAGN